MLQCFSTILLLLTQYKEATMLDTAFCHDFYVVGYVMFDSFSNCKKVTLFYDLISYILWFTFSNKMQQ